MYRIQSSVGRGGRNVHDDVLVVQILLNKNAHLVDTIGRVPEDGNLDEATQRGILAFQRDIVRLSSADGRVDPSGRTFRILTGDVGWDRGLEDAGLLRGDQRQRVTQELAVI